MVRRRGFRVFVFIVTVVALAVAGLSFREVHLSLGGISIDAAGTGPLGLTLGLDLEGGSDLRYQAALPDDLTVHFTQNVDEADMMALLTARGQDQAEIARREFAVGQLPLVQGAQDALRLRLQIEVGEIEEFDLQNGSLDVAFQGIAGESRIRFVLDELGYAESTFQSVGGNRYAIQGLTLRETAEKRLKVAMEQRLSSISSFELTGDRLRVTFEDPLLEKDIRAFLDERAFRGATIESSPQTRFTIQKLSLDREDRQKALRDALESLGTITLYTVNVREPTDEQMNGVVNIIQQRVNALGTSEPIIQRWGKDRVVVQLPGSEGSTVDVAFRPVPNQADLAAILRAVGRTGDSIEARGPNNFVLSTSKPFTSVEVDTISRFSRQVFAPMESFATGDEGKQITLAFLSPLNEAAVGRTLDELGFVDYTVEVSGPDRYTIRMKDVITTPERDRLREALEGGLPRLAAFNASGGVEDAKRLIGETAQLSFFERECLATLEELRADPRSCEPVAQGGGGRYVDRPVDITGEDLAKAFPGRDPTTNADEVNLEFKSKAADIWSDLTKRLVGDSTRRIAIFRDDEQLTAPVVTGHSPDGRTRITGNFNREEARTLAIQLESGRLPVPLEIVREDTVDALLGKDSLEKSLVAGLVGFGLVALFMVMYYRMAGVVAATALLIYGIILLAIFKLLPVTLTLSGIAGVILSIGMAVDANVLIFERMKEELRTGRSLTSSMEVGFRRAWLAIRDGNVSTIITCLILWWFGSRSGTPIITGFALTLGIGTVLSMFTAITVSQNMLQILAFTPLGRKAALFTPEASRQPVGVAGAGPEPTRREPSQRGGR